MFYSYVIYSLIMSLLCFALMGLDKRFAKKHLRRIPEKVLFGTALLGGGLGGVLAMQIFRHKTRHWSFRILFPLLLLCQIALAVLLFP